MDYRQLHMVISMINLAKLFFDIYNLPHHIETIKYPSSYPADEPNRRCPNITKAKEHLNFEANIDLRSGIQNYINWFMSEYDLNECLLCRIYSVYLFFYICCDHML